MQSVLFIVFTHFISVQFLMVKEISALGKRNKNPIITTESYTVVRHSSSKCVKEFIKSIINRTALVTKMQ